MERRYKKELRDIILSSILIALSTAVFLTARTIPHRGYDLLGAAFLPKALALGIGVLSAGLLLKSVLLLLQARRTVPPIEQAETEREAKQQYAEPGYRRRPGAGFGLIIITAAYIALLGSRLVSYAIATAAFIIVAASMMSIFEKPRNRLVRMLAVVGTALVLAYGLQYIFTEVFITDLP